MNAYVQMRACDMPYVYVRVIYYGSTHKRVHTHTHTHTQSIELELILYKCMFVNLMVTIRFGSVTSLAITNGTKLSWSRRQDNLVLELAKLCCFGNVVLFKGFDIFIIVN